MATTAKNKKDVDSMSARERLYDSLTNDYQKKGEKISQEYDKAYSQTDRQLQSRGLGRSSYGAQTLANVNKQKIDALDQNESDLIADYENRLTDIENQEKEDDRWERQFAEGQRQYNENLAYQRERANVADTQWNQQFAYQQGRDTVADTQWNKNYNEQVRQFNEQMAYNKAENAANRAFTTSEREAQQRWQSGENQANRAFTTSERIAQQNYNTSERVAQQNYNTAERVAQQNWQSSENQAARDAQRALQILSQEFQSSENALSRQAQRDLQILQQEFTAQQNRESQAWQSNENRLSREATEALQRLQQEFSAGENAKDRNAQLALQQLSQAFTAEQNALNRAESRYQYDTNLQYQKTRDQISDNRYADELAYSRERDKISDSRYEDELAYNRAFQEKQWDEQVSQWNAEFNYNKMSDSQKIAYNYVTAALELGADVSDDLLEKAGLTREDYNSMLEQSKAMLAGTTQIEDGTYIRGANGTYTKISDSTTPGEYDREQNKKIDEFLSEVGLGKSTDSDVKSNGLDLDITNTDIAAKLAGEGSMTEEQKEEVKAVEEAKQNAVYAPPTAVQQNKQAVTQTVANKTNQSSASTIANKLTQSKTNTDKAKEKSDLESQLSLLNEKLKNATNTNYKEELKKQIRQLENKIAALK